jgi:hypothetical protein
MYGMVGTTAEGAIGGSTDFVRLPPRVHLSKLRADPLLQGNVTYELPSIHPSFAIPTKPDGGNHTIGFTEAVRTEEAHEATLRVAKGLALIGFRVINDEKFFSKVGFITSVFTPTSLTFVILCLSRSKTPSSPTSDPSKSKPGFVSDVESTIFSVI